MDLLEVIAVGLPFCGFKILAGSVWVHASGPLIERIAGGLLLGLGIVDGFINVVNLVSLGLWKKRALDACFFAFLARSFGAPSSPKKIWQDLGNSLDVFLSLALVALKIAGGSLNAMPPSQLAVWNACTILSVLGAGLLRFANSVRGLGSPPSLDLPR